VCGANVNGLVYITSGHTCGAYIIMVVIVDALLCSFFLKKLYNKCDERSSMVRASPKGSLNPS
jgi:hypothetical protein